MTQQEFEKTVRENYFFETSMSYFWATFSVLIGLSVLYDLFFTSWSSEMTLLVFYISIAFGCWATYFGIRGLISTGYLFKIKKVEIKSNSNLPYIVDKIAETNGLKKQVEYKNGTIYVTKSFFKHQKNLSVFFGENFVLLNIKQQHYRGVMFLDFSGSKRILGKIVVQLRLQLT